MRDITQLGGSAAAATFGTTPRHFWMHAVAVAAIQAGADSSHFLRSDVRHKLCSWYLAGEPVWMAAHGALTISRELSKPGGGSRLD